MATEERSATDAERWCRERGRIGRVQAAIIESLQQVFGTHTETPVF